MKFFFLTFFFSLSALAGEPIRTLISSSTKGVLIETFIYFPQSGKAKGVVMVVGGSGFTRGGFGGPSKVARALSSLDFIAVEWNKRGLRTNEKNDDIILDREIYNSAIIDNIFADAQAVLTATTTFFPGIPLFVLGGSEGSVITTLLAEHNGRSIRAASAFGVVAAPFLESIEHQLSDQLLKPFWSKLDIDNSGKLSPSEFAVEKPEHLDFLQSAIFERLDVSRDGALSYAELTKYITNYFVNEHPDPDYWMRSSGVPKGWMQSMLRVPSLFERARNISIPVLIMQGEDDWNTPVEPIYHLENHCRALGYKSFTFRYYGGVGHAPGSTMVEDMVAFFESFTTSAQPLLFTPNFLAPRL